MNDPKRTAFLTVLLVLTVLVGLWAVIKVFIELFPVFLILGVALIITRIINRK